MRSILLALITAAIPTLALAQPVGFGAGTAGGAGGPTVTVQTLDQAVAALKNRAANSPITILISGTLARTGQTATRLDLDGTSNVTLLGDNAGAFLNGIGIKVYGGSSNIIIRNLRVFPPTDGDKDAIGIEGPSSHIWIDHNELSSSLLVDKDYYDGLLDTKRGADYITISYNYFHDHHKVNLNGYADSDNLSRHITWHHNLFEHVGSRVPLMRFGTGHYYNNVLSDVQVSGVNSRMGARILVENNVFGGDVHDPVVSLDSSQVGTWTLAGNIGLPASLVSNASPPVTLPYAYTADAASCVEAIVRADAGAGKALAVSDGSCGTAVPPVVVAGPPGPVTPPVAPPAPVPVPAPAQAPAPAGPAPLAPVGTGDYPAGFSKCADLGQVCKVSRGTGWIAFGRKGHWTTMQFAVGTAPVCSVAVFGADPTPDRSAKCSFQGR